MRRIFLFFVFLTLLTACSVTKRLPEGEYLLSRNNLSATFTDSLNKKLHIPRSIIKEYIPANQTPNTRVLGYNLSLRIYQMSNLQSDSWFNKVLRKVGKPPVLYDSTQNVAAMRNLKIYLDSEGFYKSKVTDTIIYKGRRANVNYKIDAGEPYFISSYRYNFGDSIVMPYVLVSSANSLIHRGDILKRSLLSDERDRIANLLQNDGFYYFNVANIDYLIDTVGTSASVVININKRLVDRQKVEHKRYRLGDITVKPTSNSNVFLFDDSNEMSNVVLDSINFISSSVMRGIRPRVLADLITVSPGEIYNKTKVADTRNRINYIPLYRSVTVKMIERADSVDNQQEGVLDCNIETFQDLRQGFKIELEASTNTNYSGFSLLFGYNNKNIFGGGETLDVGVTSGYDLIHGEGGKDSWELGGNVSLSIPRFLAPGRWGRAGFLSSLSTEVEVDINSQRRPYYDRTTTSLSYGYSWNTGKYSYQLRPISVSLISVPWKDSTYIASISSSNPYLEDSYNSQIVAGGNFSILYDNKRIDYNKILVRGNFESSGNLMSLGYHLFDAEKSDGYYNLLGIPFSQYIRSDLTFVYTTKISSGLTLAYRLYGGGGYSYGNSYIMPFARRFYAGGGSSMRGWQVRTLGPGDTPELEDVIYPNQLGNIKLETNLELRFPLYDVLFGALFFDVGNVWDNVKGESDKSARLSANRLLNQLGYNTGLGLRLDFDFFVIRMDWGVQIYNPNKSEGSRFVIKNFSFENTALHFGVGYPF